MRPFKTSVKSQAKIFHSTTIVNLVVVKLQKWPISKVQVSHKSCLTNNNYFDFCFINVWSLFICPFSNSLIYSASQVSCIKMEVNRSIFSKMMMLCEIQYISYLSNVNNK